MDGVAPTGEHGLACDTLKFYSNPNLQSRVLIQFPYPSLIFAQLKTNIVLLFSKRYWNQTWALWTTEELLVKYTQGLSKKIMHTLALHF